MGILTPAINAVYRVHIWNFKRRLKAYNHLPRKTKLTYVQHATEIKRGDRILWDQGVKLAGPKVYRQYIAMSTGLGVVYPVTMEREFRNGASVTTTHVDTQKTVRITDAMDTNRIYGVCFVVRKEAR